MRALRFTRASSLVALSSFVACSKSAPEQRPDDFSASFYSGNDYAGWGRGGAVAGDGLTEYSSTHGDATIRVVGHLPKSQLDDLHASLRAEQLQEVREAKLADIRHDASRSALRVRAGEWSVSLAENGGQEISAGEGHYDTAGRAILDAVVGEATGVPVIAGFTNQPFESSPDLDFEVPGSPPGVTEPSDPSSLEWTLHFADPSSSVQVLARHGEGEVRASFVPSQTKRVRAGLVEGAPTLAFE